MIPKRDEMSLTARSHSNFAVAELPRIAEPEPEKPIGDGIRVSPMAMAAEAEGRRYFSRNAICFS
jgi:hypothetical protein